MVSVIQRFGTLVGDVKTSASNFRTWAKDNPVETAALGVGVAAIVGIVSCGAGVYLMSGRYSQYPTQTPAPVMVPAVNTPTPYVTLHTSETPTAVPQPAYPFLDLYPSIDIRRSPGQLFCEISDTGGITGFREQGSDGHYILGSDYSLRLFFPESGASAVVKNGQGGIDDLIFRMLGIGDHPVELSLINPDGNNVPFYAYDPGNGTSLRLYGGSNPVYSSIFRCTSINKKEKGQNPPGRGGGSGEPHGRGGDGTQHNYLK